jgi:hypothetical protein
MQSRGQRPPTVHNTRADRHSRFFFGQRFRSHCRRLNRRRRRCAQVLHLQDRDVRPPFDRPGQMRLYCMEPDLVVGGPVSLDIGKPLQGAGLLSFLDARRLHGVADHPAKGRRAAAKRPAPRHATRPGRAPSCRAPIYWLCRARSHLRASTLAVAASTLNPSGRRRLSSGTQKLWRIRHDVLGGHRQLVAAEFAEDPMN